MPKKKASKSSNPYASYNTNSKGKRLSGPQATSKGVPQQNHRMPKQGKPRDTDQAGSAKRR